jgi:hypothetical protein
MKIKFLRDIEIDGVTHLAGTTHEITGTNINTSPGSTIRVNTNPAAGNFAADTFALVVGTDIEIIKDIKILLADEPPPQSEEEFRILHQIPSIQQFKQINTWTLQWLVNNLNEILEERKNNQPPGKLQASILPLNGKYYGTQIQITNPWGTTDITIWDNADFTPSERESEGEICDSHFESKYSFELAKYLVDCINNAPNSLIEKQCIKLAKEQR